jgi:hypothetical protein
MRRRQKNHTGGSRSSGIIRSTAFLFHDWAYRSVSLSGTCKHKEIHSVVNLNCEWTYSCPWLSGLRNSPSRFLLRGLKLDLQAIQIAGKVAELLDRNNDGSSLILRFPAFKALNRIKH